MDEPKTDLLEPQKQVPSTTFFDHLNEFRSCIFKCLLAFAVCACIAYSFIDELLSFIVTPIGQLVFTSPTDAFLARLTLTFVCGFIISLPITLFQIWKFVALGLKDKEKKYILYFGPFSLILFFLGASFAYFIAIPIAMNFLLGFSSEILVPMITVKNYISFVGTLILSFGIVFELPLVLLFLTKIGIASPAFLIQKRNYAYVLIFILSAIITPPDVVTMFIMSLPLILLYEFGIVMSKWVYKPSL